ncbi:hypothetical protein LNAOJCKE_4932 [Methylorubrum aminovorans]|uniref:Growth inhibitor PemK n=1 Tax=Methylorubrum aminovorans TaxID=269069 RepID=A0ABQ4UPK0_9HYPH|nr:hypothetical protein [Methylorubrum aminovorans]GJE67700.1 hypothetical protein LNAOJCKE_4932 [Methylorubrum aminovorans]GMA79854.1 hypothetical protein GCM10025880_62710 [Methylorubrum aminovorans]GMA80013.1 hypothetical protein GCM10025880_64300 [Methylorubrum aminovorans]
MIEPQHGDIILYSYLWAREYDRGEEAGRKARPTCVMLIVAGKDGRQRPLLFPITSQPPGSSPHFVEVPETEARRAKLYTPAWIIVDEFNTDDLNASWAIEDATPLGRFSRKFMSRIAAAAAVAIRAGTARRIPRT